MNFIFFFIPLADLLSSWVDVKSVLLHTVLKSTSSQEWNITKLSFKGGTHPASFCYVVLFVLKFTRNKCNGHTKQFLPKGAIVLSTFSSQITIKLHSLLIHSNFLCMDVKWNSHIYLVSHCIRSWSQKNKYNMLIVND